MYFTYIRRELRRRLKQSLVIAVGLALGIALVITVSSASAGVKNAQRQVLHSLYGVGTPTTNPTKPRTSSAPIAITIHTQVAMKASFALAVHRR